MADRSPIHSTLLNKAVKNILGPLGLIQKGRSRTWIADQGWWLIVVEFQPSSFSKGSFLNVGCNWLWNVKDYLSFDEGHRVDEQFHTFKEENEFNLVAEKLALSAAQRVMHYRNLFYSVEKISDYYLKIPPVNSFWPIYNAAIAHGLAGRAEKGSSLLASTFGTLDRTIEWQEKGETDAKLLASAMLDTDKFRELIRARVMEARSLRGLPRLDTVTFEMIPTDV